MRDYPIIWLLTSFVLAICRASGGMTIYIQHEQMGKVPIDVSPNWSARDLYSTNMVASMGEGIITFGGVPLEDDDKLLADSGVSAEATLHFSPPRKWNFGEIGQLQPILEAKLYPDGQFEGMELYLRRSYWQGGVCPIVFQVLIKRDNDFFEMPRPEETWFNSVQTKGERRVRRYLASIGNYGRFAIQLDPHRGESETTEFPFGARIVMCRAPGLGFELQFIRVVSNAGAPDTVVPFPRILMKICGCRAIS